MTYLDYSSTTKISSSALDIFNKTSNEYIGMCDNNNVMGLKCKKLLDDTTKEISNLFNVMDSEIIYTSSGTEANNMALIGTALANYKKGRHIIVSKLEHPSIYGICNYLESLGFEISYVSNDEDGLIIFDELKKLVREDTILVSICAVNSETGVRQPLKMLRQIIKKENDQTLFHSDLSQAIGKTSISFRDIDLGSVSAHKFYGPKGVGFLYKNNLVKITPLMYGGNKFSKNNPYNVSLPLIVSMKEALKSALKDSEKREKYITILNERVTSKLEKMEGIKINKTKYTIPHILSISFDNIVASDLANSLGNKDIYVSTNNKDEICTGVMALYNKIDRSKSCMRISLSHLTTVLEINRFLEIFEVEYKKLNNLIGGD